MHAEWIDRVYYSLFRRWNPVLWSVKKPCSITTLLFQDQLKWYNLSYFWSFRDLFLQNTWWIFCQTFVCHHGWGKISNLWCSNYWKMYLQVNIESRHFHLCPPPDKTFLQVLIITLRFNSNSYKCHKT